MAELTDTQILDCMQTSVEQLQKEIDMPMDLSFGSVSVTLHPNKPFVLRERLSQAFSAYLRHRLARELNGPEQD